MDVTERKEAEEERQANLWFFESMDSVNRAIQGTNDLEQMVSDVLETVLSIFHCDRAWLVYPCDPEAASWRAVMEHTRPEWPGAFALGLDLPVDQSVARVFQAGRASSGPVRFGPGSEYPVPGQLVERFGVQSLIAVAVYPKVGEPYMFGLHHCAYPRGWTPREERLFQEIGRRLADALTTLAMFRNLRESEARLEEAGRIAHLGYWDRNLDTDRITWSDETYRILGLPPQECPITFARYLELIHPEDREKMVRAVVDALRDGSRYELEYRVVRSNGEVRFVHSTCDVAKDESGQPRRMFGALQDITERKRVEEELRQRGEELDRVMSAVPDYLWSGATDSEGRWTYRYYSPVVLKILGRPTEYFLAGPERWLSTVHPDDRPVLLQAFEGLRTGRLAHWEGEYRVVRPDGTLRWVRDSASATPAAQGGRRVDGVVSDITDRKRAEEELRLRSEELDRVMASVSDYLWSAATDSEGRWTYRYYSPVVLKITGRSPEFYLVGPERWLSTVHQEDRPLLRQVFERLRTGQLEHWEGEYRVVRPDGMIRWVRDSASATLASEGGLRIDGVVSDITDRKRAEVALSEAQIELAHVNRVTTMGHLAASIAHEVNQPIGAIVVNAQAAARWLGARPLIWRRPGRPSAVSSRTATVPAKSSTGFALSSRGCLRGTIRWTLTRRSSKSSR
jgi:PAS domain S-box-containing protein